METNQIIYGNCIEKMKGLPNESVDLILTDPPYNVSSKNKIFRDYRSGKNGDISMDFGEWDYDYDPIPFLIESKRILKPTGQWLIFSGEQLYADYRTWLGENGYFKQMLIWQKSTPMPEFRLVKYRQTTEIICWALKEKHPKSEMHFNFLAQSEMTNVFTGPHCMGNERKEGGHPTQKPLWLIRELLRRHSFEGDVVLDPYMGSGTIPVACKEMNRRYIGIELDWNYYTTAGNRLDMLEKNII